jgi:hypothetical protein
LTYETVEQQWHRSAVNEGPLMAYRRTAADAPKVKALVHAGVVMGHLNLKQKIVRPGISS